MSGSLEFSEELMIVLICELSMAGEKIGDKDIHMDIQVCIMNMVNYLCEIHIYF